jgi:L-alanine-DL-glutamate epimerase-like enolase superfamily enzyme
VRIRIDANRSIDAHDLGAKLASIAPIAPEFVEEPGEPEEVVRLGSSPVSLALDETLHGVDAEARIAALAGSPEEANRTWRYGYVVLKPTVLGGIRRCAHLAECARRRGARVIVSHTLEGPIGWTACAALALSVGDAEAAAGLEPHAGLSAWPSMGLPNLDGAWIVPQRRAGLGLGDVGTP